MQYDPDKYSPYSIAGQYSIPMSRHRADELLETYANDVFDLTGNFDFIFGRICTASIRDSDVRERCRISRQMCDPANPKFPHPFFNGGSVNIYEFVITILTSSPSSIRPVIRRNLAYLHTWCMIEQSNAHENEITSGNFFLGEKVEKWNRKLWEHLGRAFTWHEPLGHIVCDSLSEYRATQGSRTSPKDANCLRELLVRYYEDMTVRWRAHCESGEVFSFPE